MKNHYFLKFLKEILLFFENYLKFYRNFRGNLGKNLESFGYMAFYGVPEPSENIK